eukprot:TRINITY_DN1830_c0_g1_i2.p2 TRINITY_DN1830_c0_g1~~TRINITY_DN1830_c0_g1_i2.p2  ORF type:complete len:128 (-),score=9.91 TRINITY_DN1830_c0_g1_i2:117-500(-)
MCIRDSFKSHFYFPLISNSSMRSITKSNGGGGIYVYSAKSHKAQQNSLSFKKPDLFESFFIKVTSQYSRVQGVLMFFVNFQPPYGLLESQVKPYLIPLSYGYGYNYYQGQPGQRHYYYYQGYYYQYY